jgi:sulfur carrier protein
MKLTVNGESKEVSANTLATLLAELDCEGAWLATAVNSEIVRSADRSACRLKEGDRIEILSPRQGG